MSFFALVMASAAIQAAPIPEVPLLGSEKPHFGFRCVEGSGQSTGGGFRYYVFMPENRPLGMPQPAKVMVIHEDSRTRPEPQFVMDGRITHLALTPPPGYKPPLGESEPYVVAVDARSAPAERTQARFQMFFSMFMETQPNGESIARIKPSSGNLDHLDGVGKRISSQKVECDDVTGRAAKKASK